MSRHRASRFCFSYSACKSHPKASSQTWGNARVFFWGPVVPLFVSYLKQQNSRPISVTFWDAKSSIWGRFG